MHETSNSVIQKALSQVSSGSGTKAFNTNPFAGTAGSSAALNSQGGIDIGALLSRASQLGSSVAPPSVAAPTASMTPAGNDSYLNCAAAEAASDVFKQHAQPLSQAPLRQQQQQQTQQPVHEQHHQKLQQQYNYDLQGG